MLVTHQSFKGKQQQQQKAMTFYHNYTCNLIYGCLLALFGEVSTFQLFFFVYSSLGF